MCRSCKRLMDMRRYYLNRCRRLEEKVDEARQKLAAIEKEIGSRGKRRCLPVRSALSQGGQ